MKRMKLLIFCIVACCLVTAGTAMAYTASGKVYDNTTTTLVPVANPTGTINEGSATNPITGQANGSYSGGWSSANLVGKTITVNAQKGSASGSKSWLAQTNTETGKDVLIKSNIAINPALKARLEPVQFANSGLQDPSTASVQVQEGGGMMEIDGFTAQITYNSNQISCDSIVFSDPDFVITEIVSVPGEVTITAATVPPTVLLMEGPERVLFDVIWDVPSFDTRDLAVVDLQLSVGAPEPNMAVPHQTEYVIGDISKSDPYFLIDSEEEWNEAMDGGYIKPVTEEEWEGYILQWGDPCNIHDGNEPYPDTNFIPPMYPPDGNLYVWEGNGVGELDPCDAGLVMYWGDPPDGNYASAFKFDFKKDPDLSNCTITVQVTAPQFSFNPPHSQVTQVSLGLQNIPIVGGPVRSWYWNVGPGTSIPWNTPTTITIDTSKTGVAATTPTATSYVSNPGFNIRTVQWIIVDENATWVGGPQNAPPPGGTIPGMWNYWHNLSVTPNTSGAADSKWYVKYSQPPVLIEPGSDPPLINGWDEISDYNNLPDPIMADDWLCEDKRPITDIHWWGSYIGWTQPYPPPIVPKAFHIGIWTDVAVGADPVLTYSHPGTLVWENYCTSTVWNFAGYDLDPFERPERENEACFQYAQFFSQDEWFYQEPNESGTNVYWLSIAAVYDAQDYSDPNFYPWGWKTRPHKFNDDACSITSVVSGFWPPQLLDVWASGDELKGPSGETWDLAFELTTNEPAYKDEPIPGDIASAGGGPPDGIVDFFDAALLFAHWLDAAP